MIQVRIMTLPRRLSTPVKSSSGARRFACDDTIKKNIARTMNSDRGKTDRDEYRDYGELWNFNLQKIETIQNEIEKSIHDLENKYVDFETAYAGITRQLDVLSSIYSGYNTVKGAEPVMRLKAVLETYRKRYTRESLDFNLVYGLLIKIADMRSASFEDFPRLVHDESPVAVTGGEITGRDYSRMPHKWITFERNRSWFIAPFSSVTIVKSSNFSIEAVEKPDFLAIDIGRKTVKVKDIFVKSLDHAGSPRCVIMLDGAARNYAADRIGRRIFAARDIIRPMVKPFRTVRSHPLSPGRLRLFGQNHLFLN
ncbi:MAG TPA: hypothetical protein PLC28_06150 [Spirochaetota bacterium]|nr:hypothetical protein [Spirochaetota bacterium]HPL16576.1 hypothetical protein [Spirochaetota bacterium]HRS78143.1 hypothetical protein [Spirochaetota bacterium]